MLSPFNINVIIIVINVINEYSIQWKFCAALRTETETTEMKYNFIIFLILLPAGLCLSPQVEAILEERKRIMLLNHKVMKESEFLVPSPLHDFENESSFEKDISYRQNREGEDSPQCYRYKPRVASTTAKKVYLMCCPKLKSLDYGTPCPREFDKWKHTTPKITGIKKDNQGRPKIYNYWLTTMNPATLYDMKPTQEEVGETRLLRFHTCFKAKPLNKYRVLAYGLGWAYLVWSSPRENCLVKYGYHIKYDVPSRTKETFKTKNAGDTELKPLWHTFHKVIVCPTFPNDFCFIISENVPPMVQMDIQVMYYRFFFDKDVDRSNWTGDTFRTDDRGILWNMCPPENILESLWFALLLGLFLFLLVFSAALLAILLKKMKKENELMQDEDWYEQEKIPPRSTIHKVWERLRNFFKELCPRPQPPPPPPPPPPPKPKKEKKKKKKKKKKIKPDPPPRRRRKRRSRRVPPPKPTRPPKRKRQIRAPDEGRKSIAKAYLDTKKAASAVGGTGRRPRPRPRRIR